MFLGGLLEKPADALLDHVVAVGHEPVGYGEGLLDVSFDSGVVFLGELLLLGGCEAVGLDGFSEVLFDAVCVVWVSHSVEVVSDLGHDLMAHLGVGLLSVAWGLYSFRSMAHRFTVGVRWIWTTFWYGFA